MHWGNVIHLPLQLHKPQPSLASAETSNIKQKLEKIYTAHLINLKIKIAHFNLQTYIDTFQFVQWSVLQTKQMGL